MEENRPIESSSILHANEESELVESKKENSTYVEEEIKNIDITNSSSEDKISHNLKGEVQLHEKEILDAEVNGKAEQSVKDQLENQSSSVEKKVKSNLKQNLKARNTIPQPFSLATERRMSKERKNLEQSSTSLSKSMSFGSKSQSPVRTIETQTSLRLERITEVRHGTAKLGSSLRSVVHTQTSVKVERSIKLRHERSKSFQLDNECVEKQAKVLKQIKGKHLEKEVEVKKSQSASKLKHNEDMEANKLKKTSAFKAIPLPSFYHTRSASLKPELAEHNEEGMETNKLRKSSTFKASPLPSFYHKKSTSSKPELMEKGEEIETNKLHKSSTLKASPLPSFYHKKASPQKTTSPQKTESIKIPIIQPKSPILGPRSKSMSELGHTKGEARNKANSRTISSNAKEAIKKLLRGPWKASNSKSKESKDSSAPCNVALDKGEIPSDNGNIVVISVDA